LNNPLKKQTDDLAERLLHFDAELRRWERAKELTAAAAGTGKPKVDELDYDEQEEERRFNQAMERWEIENPHEVWRENSPYYNSSRNRYRRAEQ
jgi:hypothetical protein